jgi:hypothetical protein
MNTTTILSQIAALGVPFTVNADGSISVNGAAPVAPASEPVAEKPAKKAAKKAAEKKAAKKPPAYLVAGWAAANAVYASAGFGSHGEFFEALTAARKASKGTGGRGRPSKAVIQARETYAVLQDVYQAAKAAGAAARAGAKAA